MTRYFTAALAAALWLAAPAAADQAQCLTRAQADKAAAVLRGEARIRHYCAPCHDEGWREAAVATVEVVEGDCGAEVRVDGVGIDLAYVYVLRKDRWVNFAKVVGVKVRDVPKRLPDGLPARPE